MKSRILLQTLTAALVATLTTPALSQDLVRTEWVEVNPFFEEGKLGRKTGEGFYTYPEPEFERPGFLDGTPH